ncbi:MAG TPA: preprotein translocase subunit SecA [Gammaproteobacteria bacterium]|nr:preprotein translocase subunit SecA [Gammaproteobacteria bacterium]
MLGTVTRKIFGSRNERLIKQCYKVVAQINSFEAGLEGLSDEALQSKTAEFRSRLEQGASLNDLLPEAFAVVREASKRVMGMRHYDVQLIGGMVLNDAKIAEMRTGEGKTLVATLAAYLNALPALGVHVITVNDYLAKRDAEWMGKLYNFLGLTVGVIVNGMTQQERQAAYAADITYGTNNEYGFDYLRDNMAFSLQERVQRGLNFAIIDEVDSILIDEARTPLIISGQAEESSELYKTLNKIVPSLVKQEDEDAPGDFSVDEKSKQVFISEEGHDHVETLLVEAGLMAEGDSLYNPVNIGVLHHLNASLRAHALFERDVDYIVRNREVVIVDEFTGRTMQGRRWSDGLHQAIEAKEGVEIKPENHTLASITFQNYFRMYAKLSGMTGTADTEAFEFQQIYGLEVVVIPTHRPMVRNDMNDLVYLRHEDKFKAIIEDIRFCLEQKRPVLVGTASIDTSEYLSGLLKKAKIRHEVLNAKQPEREAHIIEQAGQAGSVTIATNMAGRGTDIVLGGSLEAAIAELGDDASESDIKKAKADWQQRHDQVIKAGGLHIIGTERHESRRVDNQLRGRAGRQGDAGSSRFFVSLEDNLMRIFASDRMRSLMERFGMDDGEAIENTLVSKSIENAQRKVEAHNFDIRKNLLEYDDVASDQRKVIYEQRDELLASDDISEVIKDIRDDSIAGKVMEFIPPGSIEDQWDIPGLETALKDEFTLEFPVQQWLDEDDALDEEGLIEKILAESEAIYQQKEEKYSSSMMRQIERDLMLQVLDNHWKEHLAAMDYLRQSVGLRGYAQKDPKQEYKREAFEMFQGLLERVKYDVSSVLMRLRIESDAEAFHQPEASTEHAEMEFQHPQAESALDGAEEGSAEALAAQVETPFKREQRKVGRNEPCPCGSGKKYKQCHGKLA